MGIKSQVQMDSVLHFIKIWDIADGDITEAALNLSRVAMCQKSGMQQLYIGLKNRYSCHFKGL